MSFSYASRKELGAKRPASPNDNGSSTTWESADLGDDERKLKFLRLMGAGKKDHSGRAHSGDHKSTSHFRTGEQKATFRITAADTELVPSKRRRLSPQSLPVKVTCQKLTVLLQSRGSSPSPSNFKEYMQYITLRFVFPQAAAKQGDEDKKINEELEHQFHQSLDSQLSGRNRRHCGLGFSEPEPADSDQQQVSTGEHLPTNSLNDSENKGQLKDYSSDVKSSSEERQSEDANTKKQDLKSNYKMMFVKSSTN